MKDNHTFPGFLSVIRLAHCHSTNSYIKEHVHELARRFPLLVTARCQDKGRGRQDRVWESPADLGIYSSFGFYLENPQQLRLLSLAAGIAVIETLESLYQQPAGDKTRHNKSQQHTGYQQGEFALKWPNDIVFDFRKISGILVENILAGEGEVTCITGIGININQQAADFPPELQGKAVSLRMISGKTYNLEKVNRVLSRHFFCRLENIKKDEETVIIEKARNYSQFLLHKEIVFHNGRQVIRGIFRGLHDDGGLILQEGTAAGQCKKYYAGEITFDKHMGTSPTLP